MRVACVTGASRGIGRAIAVRLAGEGYAVAAVARGRGALDALCAELRGRGTKALAVAADLRDPAATGRIAERVARELGPIELLVNNAGTAPTAKLERTDDAMLDEALDLHVRAPLRLLRAVLPSMRAADRGVLIQLASTAGLRGFAFTTAYTAAKHGMVGLTRALAEELRGTSVRAYALCPGFVDSDITRAAAADVAARGKTTAEQALAAMGALNAIGRMHSTSEVADAVAMLARERPDGCVYLLDRDPPGFV